MTQTPAVSNTARKRAQLRQQLLGCGAMAICLGVLAVHAPAAAQSTSGQSFQGAPSVVVPGSATVVQTATQDTITVTAPQAVINWTPNDRTGTGTIDFLPVGKSARFTGLQDFTVLNRIIPLDGNDIPIARMIALNGTITSDIGGQQPGGNVWFYSPGGIFVGSSGVINVGSLVLSARDIDTSGGLFGPGGHIRFRNPNLAGTDTARIEIASGASITARNSVAGSSYIALVAPRIVQAGTVTADGSVALVAAEQADIRINNGLFDINVLVGSGDSNGIVHTGTTGGPSDTSADYENRAYFVAVPKNQAMTMLLAGTIGFETVNSVTFSEGGIVLSAGHNVVGGIATVPVNGNTGASISVGDTTFLNTLDGFASDSIIGRPSNSCTPACIAGLPRGQIQFRKNSTLTAGRLVDFSVGNAQQIIAGGNLTLRAGRNGTGGTVRMSIDNSAPPSPGTSGNGLITVAGQLFLDASASGISAVNNGIANGGAVDLTIASGQLTAGSILARANGNGDRDNGGNGADGFGGSVGITVNGGGAINASSLTAEANGASTALVAHGGSGTGGTASLLVNGGTLNVTGSLLVSAQAGGQIGTDTSGSGTGGTASLRNLNGTVNAATTTVTATGLGGGILDQLANPGTPNTVIGGAGNGGTILFESSGTSNLGVLSLIAEGIGGESQPISNLATAQGGDGRGGTITASILFGTTTVTNATFSANAHGGSSGGTLGTTGAATGGTVGLTNLGGFFQVGIIPLVDGNLTIAANANVDAQDGGTVANIQGGTIDITSSFDSAITVNNQLDLQATAIAGGGPLAPPVVASGTAIGGIISLTSEAGNLTADTARIDASALTASATGTAGNAQGGNVFLTSTNSGNLSFNQLNSFDANGSGGNGAVGGAGTGGEVSIRAATGSINLGGSNFINANGVAGMSAAANPPRTGTGGTLTIEATDESGSQFTFGEIYAAVNGGSALPPFSSGGPVAPTRGIGGSATIALNAPRTVGTLLSILANGYGANGGNGRGGMIDFLQTAGSIGIASMALDADGFGGDGSNGVNAGAGGRGAGGRLTVTFTGGQFSSDEVNLSSRGTGGIGARGGTAFQGPGPLLAGDGGAGFGGSIDIAVSGPLDGTAQVSIGVGLIADTGAEGGAGGDVLMLTSGDYTTPGSGGLASAGDITLRHDGGILSDGADGPAVINLLARAIGGRGGVFDFDLAVAALPTDPNSPDGGLAVGGTIDVTLATPLTPDSGGRYLLDSSAFGGDGGASLTGGSGGGAAGGASRLTIDAVNASAVDVQLVSEGRGGHGGDGINGAGGAGGLGDGGTAKVQVNGLDGAVVLEGARFVVDGFGGAGGNGGVSNRAITRPVNGFDGGSGGDGTGGVIELETNDGMITLSDPQGNGVTLSSNGFGGAGGNGADNVGGPANIATFGGNAGFGGVGSGGTITLRTNGGTIASDPNVAFFSAEVGGTGGAGASGGAGNVVTLLDPQTGQPIGTVGGSGFSTGQTFNQAGRIRFEANDSVDSLGSILLRNTLLQANGDLAGRIELIDNSDGAGLSFDTLTAEATGSPFIGSDFSLAGSGIYINSRDGAIQLGNGTTTLRSSGTIQIDAANNGGLSAAGQININGGAVVARHTNPGANTPTIFSGNNINVTASLIDFQSGTLISALAGMSLQSDSIVNFDRLTSRDGGILVDAVGNITGNSAAITAPDGQGFAINLLSRGGGVRFTTLASTSQILVSALGGSIIGGTAHSAASMNLDARDAISFDQLTSDNFVLALNAGTNVTGGSLSSGGTSTIVAGGNVQFGTNIAARTLSVRAGGTITGTSATATLIGGPGLLLSGTGGVNVGSVTSAGETGLIATNGAVVVGNLHSTGTVRADARSVTITGSGGLDFFALNATAGDARVTATSGDLTVQSGTVSGTATLTTQGGALTVQNLTGNRVVLGSNTTARIAGTVTGTTELVVTSTGATIVDGIATGGTVRIASGDITIGASGRVGTGGTTSLVELINGDSSVRTYIGGNDQANAYSLSAAEMLRLFGTNITIRAPRVSTQSSAALGSTRPPDVVIGAFTFNGAMASTGNLGAGGTLSIITPGSARVIGAAQLSNMSDSNGFAIRADESIEVILGQGSIRLAGTAPNGLGGILTLDSEDIAVATASAISDIADASDIAAINRRLGMNDGVTIDDGALTAATLNLDASNGLYIQNSGASDRTAQRRGFTANTLQITSGGTGTRIVINGRVADTLGGFQTGADTVAQTLINDVQAGPGGAFAPGSTINGCAIANVVSCRVSFDFHPRDIIHNALSSRRGRAILRNLILLGLGRGAIHIRDVDPLIDEPLLDEPITGAGNDDLWVLPDGE